jgi:hypothetical protein
VAQDRDEYDNETLATEQAGNNLLTGWVTISFVERTLFCGVS